jgi:D-tyrosyl-tRNA(Tyr) deacylase
MIALVQRVQNAVIEIDGKEHAAIGKGILVLLGVAENDGEKEAEWLARKVTGLRIFSDENGKMNLDLAAVQGEIMVVSQFTLLADPSQGNRPSYMLAARPEKAIPLYKKFNSLLEGLTGKPVLTGVFAADMQISLCNDGPVTIYLNTEMHSGTRRPD